MTRARKLRCGHDAVRVDDYTESYRWRVHCAECGSVEHWTHREWRQSLGSAPAALVRIGDESARLTRV